jgi:hypothetical protein
MSIERGLPFERGSTYFAGATPVATAGDASYDFEGREYEVDDIIYTAGPTKGTLRSREKVILRVVRNTAGFALEPKRVVSFENGTHWGRRVDGYVNATSEHGYPVDEYLKSTGVPDDDLFYIVVSGPATVLSGLANANSNQFTYGADILALTAATSGATTAGRVRVLDTLAQITSQATDLATVRDSIRSVIGRAMTTQGATSHTAVDLLVRINRYF